MRFSFNFLPKTLLARFMLIVILPPLIVQLVLIFLFYDRHWYNVSYYTSGVIANEINSLLKILEHSDSYYPPVGEYLNLSYEVNDTYLPNKQVKLTEELLIFKNILTTKTKRKNIILPNTSNKITILIALKQQTLKIFIPTKLLLSPTTTIFILWVIFLTITLVFISLLFCRNQIKSILELAHAADSFGQDNRSSLHYKPRGAREIRKAGIAIIKMKDRIERQIKSRTHMLAMISHDLRTPLTRIRLQIEFLQDQELKDSIIDDISTMNLMINSYLDFARGEGGEQLGNVDIYLWLKDFITLKYANSNINLLPYDKNIITAIKKIAFERLVSNLINNSLKYATLSEISIRSNDKSIILNFEDNGPSIPDSEKSLVFKTFYRSDKSRNVGSSGNIGLGLTIAREIITNMQGTISLSDSKRLGGLSVNITLPKINNKEQ